MYNYCTLGYPLSLPLPKVTCGSSQPSPGTSETLGSRYLPMYSPSPPISLCSSRLFICCQVLITQLCSQIWILHLSHRLPPSLQGLGEGGCGAAGSRQPSHPIPSRWERRQSISPALTGQLEGPRVRPDRQVQPVMQPPTLSVPAGRQNASEVCTAAPSLNNVRLCRRLPHSHPSTTPLRED